MKIFNNHPIVIPSAGRRMLLKNRSRGILSSLNNLLAFDRLRFLHSEQGKHCSPVEMTTKGK